MRNVFALLGIALIGTSFVPLPAASDDLSADAIFARTRGAWNARTDPPFVQYALRERYTWRSRVHDNWWQVSFRASDRAMALHRQIVPGDEAARLKGVPISLRFKMHNGYGKADSLETNADADAFPILDPQIEPNASFGLLRRDRKAALVGAEVPSASPAVSVKQAVATPTPSPNTANSASGDKPLRVLVTVEAASRDYTIVLDGTERIHDTDAYHLKLTPLRDPDVYRLRDLWVDTTTFATLQISLAGLFEGEPYKSARWTISYVDVDGHSYIQQVRTDDQLRFGADRFVSGLQFDFVQYQLPPALPDMMFDHYL